MNYIFDLDGTLIENSDIVRETVLKLSRNFMKTDSQAQLGGSRYQRLKQKYARYHHVKTTEYLDQGLIQLAPGVEKFLEDQQGYIAGLTNAPYDSTETKLTRLGLRKFMDEVLTPRDVERKPNPQGVEKIVQNSGLEPKDFVFVGNSIKDVFAGKRAGVRTVAIGESRLKSFFADEVYSSFQEFAESR